MKSESVRDIKPHPTVPVQVTVDVDTGVADLVRYLNTIPGVRTHASCQGTLGEGGAAPYPPQVMVSWPDDATFERLSNEFDVSDVSEGGHWCYVHPKPGWFDLKKARQDPEHPFRKRERQRESSTVATECSVCGAGIVWQKDFDRPYPVNADGFLHRCAPQYTLASRLIEEAQLQRETYPQSHRTRAAAELLTEAAQALKGNDHGVSV